MGSAGAQPSTTETWHGAPPLCKAFSRGGSDSLTSMCPSQPLRFYCSFMRTPPTAPITAQGLLHVLWHQTTNRGEGCCCCRASCSTGLVCKAGGQHGLGSAPPKERRETTLVFQGAFIEFKSTKSGFYHVLFLHSELVKLPESVL